MTYDTDRGPETVTTSPTHRWAPADGEKKEPGWSEGNRVGRLARTIVPAIEHTKVH